MGDLVVGAALGKNDGARYYSPRVDRMAEKPSADNAQGLYLPNACVFVAKYVVDSLNTFLYMCLIIRQSA